MHVTIAPASNKSSTAAIRALLSQKPGVQVKGLYRDLKKVPDEFTSANNFTAVQGDVGDVNTLDFSGSDAVLMVLPPAYDEEGNNTLPVSVRKLFYSLDLVMHAVVNSKERRMDDWLALVKRADDRFELKSVSVIPGQPFSIMEFIHNIEGVRSLR